MPQNLTSKFETYRNNVLKMPFANLPWADMSALKSLRIGKKFKNIVVVGMGGSSLGAKAISAVLKNSKMIFLDNVDPDFVHQVLKEITSNKTLFVLISKSGETLETLSLAPLLFAKIKPPHNYLVITDDASSPLGLLAKRNKIPLFISPADVAGRFSALSIVGLLPCALAGIPISRILEGARKTPWKQSFRLACEQVLQFKKGKRITVIFPYCELLNKFADWYIQLLSESIGKTRLIGITPVKAIGVKDQHSQLQLFLDGPDDKFFILIKVKYTEHDSKIPGTNMTLKKLFDAEYEGVKSAFLKKKKPFWEIGMPEISPETVGELLFFFELQIAFLGLLLKVNTFNQPAVELSKKITKSLLK
ncbi:MAG: SIS domain-containing protein [Patescibacteria group bacterium]